MQNSTNDNNFKIIAKNRKARYNYEILEHFEAGIVLLGTEVKSIRLGHMLIHESYVGPMANDRSALYLFNCDIPVYKNSQQNHEPRRVRKLLLHKKQAVKLINLTRERGMSIVCLTSYFNHKGMIKLTIALARGKNKVDKRETEAKRDWDIEKRRLLKCR